MKYSIEEVLESQSKKSIKKIPEKANTNIVKLEKLYVILFRGPLHEHFPTATTTCINLENDHADMQIGCGRDSYHKAFQSGPHKALRICGFTENVYSQI